MQLKAARFPPVLIDVQITLYNCLVNSVICRMKYSGSGLRFSILKASQSSS